MHPLLTHAGGAVFGGTVMDREPWGPTGSQCVERCGKVWDRVGPDSSHAPPFDPHPFSAAAVCILSSSSSLPPHLSFLVLPPLL
jgi:hypothetical protein